MTDKWYQCPKPLRLWINGTAQQHTGSRENKEINGFFLYSISLNLLKVHGFFLCQFVWAAFFVVVCMSLTYRLHHENHTCTHTADWIRRRVPHFSDPMAWAHRKILLLVRMAQCSPGKHEQLQCIFNKNVCGKCQIRAKKNYRLEFGLPFEWYISVARWGKSVW